MMKTAFRGAAGLLAVAGMVLGGVTVASNAQAEPNPCAGHSDGGTGGAYKTGASGGVQYVHIYGTYYNCSGTSGAADRRRIDVSGGASDTPCISIPYGTSKSVDYEYGYTLPPQPGYRKWYAC